MSDASADDYDGFQAQFTNIMETILQTAVREATKLYDGTLQRLKAELVQLRQENVNTKTGDSSSQNTKRLSEAGRTGNVSKHRDIGVQCEKPTFVDRGCSPLQFIGQRLNVGDITSDKLIDLCASEDGNRQLALLLVKQEPQETECNSYAPGYFLLKQEGAEPILVRREPNKDTMERVDNFEADVPFSSCCTERNDKDLSEDDDTPTLQSRLRKQRKICSKSRQIDPADEDGTLLVKDKRVVQ
ncbi:hypothetical protein cypCar_00010995, partial [Cyprinus carpio]